MSPVTGSRRGGAVRGIASAVAIVTTMNTATTLNTHVEATVTPDNAGSIALFSRFAERRGAPVRRDELFGEELLGDGHLPEILFRIGPVRN